MMMMMIITWGQELHACLLRPRSTLVARKIRFSICRPAATPYTQPDSHTCALTRTHAHTDTYTPLVNRPCPMAWAVCQLTRVPGRAPYADTYTCPRRSSFTPLRQLCCVLCAGGLRLCHCCLRLRLRCRCDPPHQRLRLLAEPRCRLPSVRLDRTIIVGNARKR